MTEKLPVEQMSFEAALQELQAIVGALESGNAPLDQSIEAYERGIALKRHCEGKLREAQAKIEKISVTQDGRVETAPFEEE
jgi:exodeoxyribonuclease VII small subunit